MRRRLTRSVLVLALLGAVVSLAPSHPASLSAPERAQAASVASRMVALARAELRRGVREIPEGSNRGTRIRMYGGSTSPRFYPAPWCAYFVSWLARRAGRPLGPSGQGFGYVPYIKAWALRTGKWRKAPRSGDLVMFPQHVGMVEQVFRNGTLTTIEGNSSNRVARRWRRWGDASGYVRFATGGAVVAAPKAGDRPATKPKGPPAKLTARISIYPAATVATGQEAGFSANDSSGDIVRYAWDLDGDGRFDDATGDNAERAYDKPGAVKVALRVTDRRGRSAVARRILTVQANRPPVAVLDAPAAARANEKVELDAGASSDPDGEVVRYQWDTDADGVWEDGGAERTVTLRRPGVHPVGLRVVDDRGAVAEAIRTIQVTSSPPVAKASAPARSAVNRELWLDGSRSRSPEGAQLTWSWDVGADGTVDATGERAAWRPETPGARTVKLVVTDEWGGRAETTTQVEITNEGPGGAVDLVGAAVAGDAVTLDGSRSSDPDSRVVSYEWDFDDDGRYDATGVRPTFKPGWVGWKTVRLRLTDDFGAVSTHGFGLRVQDRPRPKLALQYSEGLAGRAVAFSAAGSSDADGWIDRLEWDFDGDGRTDQTTWSPAVKPWWTYAKAGTYAATVTATDNEGLRTRVSVTVTMRQP